MLFKKPSLASEITNKRIGLLEALPLWVKLIPIVSQWLFLSLRYGSVTLPSSANPHITSGGMVGEGKLEYFEIMGHHARTATAPYISALVGANTSAVTVVAMAEHGLQFPIIAKPDIGWCGFGVQLIENEKQLKDYFDNFPAGHTVVIQEYIPFEGEAGIFYARHPRQEKGKIIGMVLRYFPRVTGDGLRNVGLLISDDLRLQRLQKDDRHVFLHDQNYVPAQGEIVRLSIIGSTRVGGLYRDGTKEVTDDLTNAIDTISQDMREFHIGRFDVRYKTLADLHAGRFTIIEVNGSGSEAVHAWDPSYTLWQAFKIIFAKQRLLFQIAAAKRCQGYRPIGIVCLTRLYFMQQKLIKRYPPSH